MTTNYINEGLTAGHITSSLDTYEAARSGFFSFIVNDIDNIVKSNYSGEQDAAVATDKIAKAQEYLKLNVVSASVPNFSIKVEQYRRGNEEVKWAGVPTFDAGTIKVDDIVGLDTKEILYAWRNLAYNVHTRKGGRMKNYKKSCTLIEYTQDYEQIRSWTLEGCWISKLSESDFDKENDGKRQITATIEYDRAYEN